VFDHQEQPTKTDTTDRQEFTDTGTGGWAPVTPFEGRCFRRAGSVGDDAPGSGYSSNAEPGDIVHRPSALCCAHRGTALLDTASKTVLGRAFPSRSSSLLPPLNGWSAGSRFTLARCERIYFNSMQTAVLCLSNAASAFCAPEHNAIFTPLVPDLGSTPLRIIFSVYVYWNDRDRLCTDPDGKQWVTGDTGKLDDISCPAHPSQWPAPVACEAVVPTPRNLAV
jgi:hypothetical protein